MAKDIHIDFYKSGECYWWSVIQRKEVTYALRRFSDSGSKGKILDVGCGAGVLLSVLSQDARVYGTDLSIKACEFSKRKGINVLQADAHCLPLKDNSFNVVFALDLIEHIEDELTVLKQIYRVCSEGGICIFTVPAWNCLWGARDEWLGHKRRYIIPTLRQMAEKAGFKIIRCNYFIASLFPILFFANKIKRLLRCNTIKSDVARVPRLLNTFLIYFLTAEGRLLSHFYTPIGTSIVCIARKP